MDWSFLQQRVLGHTIETYCWFFGILLIIAFLRKTLSKFITYLGSQVAARFSDRKHIAHFSELVSQPIQSLLITVLSYIAFQRLDTFLDFVVRHKKTSDGETVIRVDDILDHVFLFFVILFITQILFRLIDFIYHVQYDNARQDSNKNKVQLLPLVKEMIKVLVGTISLFWILGSVFMVNVPALVTGLGIGGIAIALAGKESVENLFASIMILSDKPFAVDDVIKTSSVQGRIERIGFRSTSIRNTDGSVFIVPNKSLVDSTLENISRSLKRRVQTQVVLKFGLKEEDVKAIIDTILKQLHASENVLPAIEVGVDTFSDNSFTLLVQYFVKHPQPDSSVKYAQNLAIYKIIKAYLPADSVNIKTDKIIITNKEEGEA